MSHEVIPSKWEFIAGQLRKLNAPDEIVNAALEIENILISLNLDYNTQGWINNYNLVSNHNSMTAQILLPIIKSSDFCSACDDCESKCRNCKLGDNISCTPCTKYSSDYYRTICEWVWAELICDC